MRDRPHRPTQMVVQNGGPPGGGELPRATQARRNLWPTWLLRLGRFLVEGAEGAARAWLCTCPVRQEDPTAAGPESPGSGAGPADRG